MCGCSTRPPSSNSASRRSCSALSDSAAVSFSLYELTELSAVLNDSLPSSPELTKLSNRLREINRKLWHVEDEIRECELREDFGLEFVELARSVYRNNDSRSEIKRKWQLTMDQAEADSIKLLVRDCQVD